MMWFLEIISLQLKIFYKIKPRIFIGMKQVLLLGFILFSSFCLNAQESKEIKTETSVNFKIKNFGVNVGGHFQTIKIRSLFNSEHELTDISVTIDVLSVITGMKSRDKHLLKEDFFYVDKFDRIVLETISLKKESSNKYTLTGNLTIKGISKQITIPIKIETTEKAYIISSNFEINRKDFNVGGSSLVLSKNVKISVKHTKQF